MLMSDLINMCRYLLVEYILYVNNDNKMFIGQEGISTKRNNLKACAIT